MIDSLVHQFAGSALPEITRRRSHPRFPLRFRRRTACQSRGENNFPAKLVASFLISQAPMVPEILNSIT